MKSASFRPIWLSICGLAILASEGTAQAQRYTAGPGSKTSRPSTTSPRTGKTDAGRTTVTVEILTGGPAAGFRAHEWRPIFEKMGVAFRIRGGTAADKVETRERQLGTVRQIVVTGKLDRSGRLIFAERTFSRSEADKLHAWLGELQTYGAQGSPEGKPLWGLTKAQFGAVYAALNQPLESEVEGLTLDAALKKMALPDDHPVRLSAAARESLRTRSRGTTPVRQKLKGRSLGTALAIVLNDYGLGFRPQRTPAGSIELAVEPLEKAPDAWPVGWEFKDSRFKTARKLFVEQVPVELEDAPFLDVLEAVSTRAEVPVYIDHYRIEAAGIDLDKLRVSFPRKKTSWSLLLRRITFQHRLSVKYRIDEQGQPFVWITTLTLDRGSRIED